MSITYQQVIEAVRQLPPSDQARLIMQVALHIEGTSLFVTEAAPYELAPEQGSFRSLPDIETELAALDAEAGGRRIQQPIEQEAPFWFLPDIETELAALAAEERRIQQPIEQEAPFWFLPDIETELAALAAEERRPRPAIEEEAPFWFLPDIEAEVSHFLAELPISQEADEAELDQLVASWMEEIRPKAIELGKVSWRMRTRTAAI